MMFHSDLRGGGVDRPERCNRDPAPGEADGNTTRSRVKPARRIGGTMNPTVCRIIAAMLVATSAMAAGVAIVTVIRLLILWMR
jgi:hypothetical protein